VSSEVIAFPSARRRAEVLHAVNMLNQTHGEAANEAWRSLMRSMAAQLTAVGVSAGEMRQQVLEFQAAVQLELQAQSEMA
jgi:predicted secreted protein